MEPPPALPQQPRQGLAISSLVLGVLGNICLGPFAGIPAIITGHVAYSRSRRLPGVYAGGGFAIAGLVLGYVSLVVGTAMIAILAAFSLPAMAKAKAKASSVKCMNNMKHIALAAHVYAAEHNDQFPTNFASMGPQLNDPKFLVCPADTRQPMPGTDWSLLTPAHISYEFLKPGASTDEIRGETVFRCPIHNHSGMGDGSVMGGR